MSNRDTVLVLDAMGVIYTAADDVAELLVPFINANGGIADAATIAEHYTSASLGQISSADFWHAVRVSPDAEDSYLAKHKLNEGLLALLNNPPSSVASIWCLSNDVAEWSRKLRTLHKIEDKFSGFVISGDVGVRKPHPSIYDRLLAATGESASSMLFVDDKTKNLDAARSLGFRTVQLDATVTNARHDGTHACIESFDQLTDLLGQ